MSANSERRFMSRYHSLVFAMVLTAITIVPLVAAQSAAQESAVPTQAAPAELRAWVTQVAPGTTLQPGSYPLDQLKGVLPPHAPQLLTAETTNGSAPTLDVVAPRVYDIPASERVHQLKPNGELDDTTHCGRELPFPGLSATTERAGLKAIWNLLCRNRGGTFEILGGVARGSGPKPHRSYGYNERYGYGPQGFGVLTHMLFPDDQKGSQTLAWVPWTRNETENLYTYQDELRRVRRVSANRGDQMAGMRLTREQTFMWEGQFFVYDWTVLGERPVLAVLDSQHTFAQYLPRNRWFPEDQWMLRPSLLVVGKRAHKRAGAGYVALWLDTATFEPLWAVYYDEAGTARSILVHTLKWNAQVQRHVTLGQSVVEVDASGVPVAGTVFEAAFCRHLHYPEKSPADASAYSGHQLGKKLSWGGLPPGCD